MSSHKSTSLHVLSCALVLALFTLSRALFAFDGWMEMRGTPRSGQDVKIIEHAAYVLGYDENRRLAVWACVILKEKDLALPRVKRTNRFLADPAIASDPVAPGEYARSGFDRGHLVAVADVAHSETAMRESFYMSNMAPQAPACNRGVWRKLEAEVRNIAKREKAICVFTGPIFMKDKGSRTTIGPRALPVPDAFYKVVLDLTPPMKAIAFIVPNRGSKESLWMFATTVDQAEALTGLDFFHELPDELENALESHADAEAWK